MRKVRHKPDSGHVLFDYSVVSSYDDCPNRIVCFSNRDYQIILNALEFTDKMRTRVYTEQIYDLYTIANDDQWSNFQDYIGNIRSRMGEYIMCNEYLERIAVALEAQLQLQDEQTIDLFDVLEALGIEPSEEDADILEALDYILDFPGINLLPNFKIPKTDFISSFFAGRYRSATLQLLRDISISQRAQATAQGGVDFAALYDTMGETAESLIVKAGWLGKAHWLWRWVDNDQIPGWLGWVTTVSGLVLGSVRDATYRVKDAIEGLSFQDISDAIREATDTTIVNCNNCTASQLYNIINDDTNQGPYAVVEQDSVWPDPNEPPASDDTTWSEPEFPDDNKCKASRYIVGWMIGFYGREEWELETTDNLLTLAEKFKIILGLLPPIGVTLSAVSVIIGRTLAYISSGQLDIFVSITEVLTDLEEQLVCSIYNSGGPDEAREAFKQILLDDGRLTVLDINFIMVFLTINNVMALPFYTNTETAPLIDMFGTACDCGEVTEYVFGLVHGTVTSGQLEPATSVFVIDAEAGPDVGGQPRYWIVLDFNEGAGCVEIDISSTGWSDGVLSENFIGSLIYPCETGEYELVLNVPPEYFSGRCFFGNTFENIQFNSASPFTVTFTLVGPCP